MTLPEVYLFRDEVRECDRVAIEKYKIPGCILMENAARSAAEWLHHLQGGVGSCLIYCGTGNNAGDGLVMARHLHLWGWKVLVVLAEAPSRFRGDALLNWNIVAAMQIPVYEIFSRPTWQEELAAHQQQAPWAVDALFGTGLNRNMAPPYGDIVDLMNQHSRHCLAVDIPSGLDADTGEPLGNAVRADFTATFVAPKKGFLHASSYLGEVKVFGIGAPIDLATTR
ncbi:MAG: NAD(P)H-hydrate epimerase [Zavarzinella sp.]